MALARRAKAMHAKGEPMTEASLLRATLSMLLVAIPCQPLRADSAGALRDSARGVDWPGYGRSFGEQHFSPLAQIDDGNVARLSLAWSIDLAPGNSVTAPIAVDGVKPTNENINSGSYKISRPLLVLKKGELTAPEKAFVDALLSPAGMKIVSDMGFVPAK